MSVAQELQQKYTPVQFPPKFGKWLGDCTPDFVLEHDYFDPRRAHAFLEFEGKLYYDPKPGKLHVEIAQELGLPDWRWYQTAIQGRVGVYIPKNLNVVSFYPYQIETLNHLQTIIRQVPNVPEDALLTGFGTVYRVADVLGRGRQRDRMQSAMAKRGLLAPGQKWWAPHSEGLARRLDEILG